MRWLVTKAGAMVAAFLLATLAQYVLRGNLLAGLALFSVSMILIVIALAERPSRLPARMRFNLPLGLVVALALAALILYARNVNSAFGFYFFLASVFVFLFVQVLNDRASRGLRLQREGWRIRWVSAQLPQPESLGLTRAELLLLGAIVCLALFLRVYAIGVFPAGLSADEARPALEALRVLQQPDYRPVFIPRLDNADLDVYLLAGSFSLLGAGALVVKIWPLLAGLAGVVAFYWLCHDHVDRWVALAGAFLLATSRWDIHFSRLAWGAILVPLFALLTILFLLRGFRSSRRLDFVWAGAALGAGLYTYIGFRLFPIVIVVFLIYQFVADRDFIAKHKTNLAYFAFSAALVVAPLGLYAILHPAEFLFRSSQVFLGNNLGNANFFQSFLDNFSKALLMFNYQGSTWAEHNLPGEPMLDPATGILFVLGLGYALWNWRKPLYFVLLTWFGVITLTSVLTYENPHALRTIGNIPAVYLLVVLLLDRLWSQAKPLFASRWRAVAFAGVGVLAAFILGFNFYTYFVRQAGDPNVWRIFEPDVNDVGYRMAAQRDQADFYVSAKFYYSPIVRFLSYCPGDKMDAPPFYHLFEEPSALPLRASAARAVTIVYSHRDLGTAQALKTYYPDGQASHFDDRKTGTPLAEYYAISAPQVSASRGLLATYTSFDKNMPSITRRESTPLSGASSEPTPMPPPFRAEWNGLFVLPTSGAYTLDLRSSVPVTLTIDDRVRLQGAAGKWTIQDAPGVHTFHADAARVDQADAQISLTWTTPDGLIENIPASAFFAPPPAHGLVGYYYHNDAWNGIPERRVDPSLEFNWGDFASQSPTPGAFTVEWRGEIETAQAGNYLFSTASDDGSWLYVDDKLLIDNGGKHMVRQADQGITLAAGRHKLRVRYVNFDGDKSIKLMWKIPSADALQIVPSDVLYPVE